MKIGIFYAGKTGTTSKCAIELAGKVENADAFDLTKSTPKVDEYDVIVLGSSIRIGQLHKAVKKFIADNTEALATKRMAYFICNGSTQESRKVFEMNFTREQLEEAICFESFGGEFVLENQKGIDKLIMKQILKKEEIVKPEILHDVIDKFAAQIIK